jgi:NAD(P)-dependent dehydrogenase (short-subunit alcohol dehydrogenase family)
MAMKTLAGRIAVVAGASRGAGRGIALALGEAGATVYVAGRTSAHDPRPGGPVLGTIEATADEVTRRGGRGIAVRTDCTDEAQVEALFARVDAEQSRLDVLANAVWGLGDAFSTMDQWMAAWAAPFWEQPPGMWGHMVDAGPRAYFLTSRHALPLMIKTGRGLIVGVTDGYFESAPGVAAESIGHGPLLWSLSHQCINLLMKGLAGEVRKHKIAVVTLMPGFMRTEAVVRFLTDEKLKKQFGFEKAESTEYLGRAVAALAADRKVGTKSGKVHFVADLAAEYDFTDVDGRRVPRFNPFG